MDNLSQFADAVKKGVGSTPGFKSAFGLDNWINPAMSRAGQSMFGNAFVRAAGVQADEEERRRAQAAKEAEARASLENDPSKYQRLRKDDGGFAFYDPFGKEIDIDTYSKKTGQKRFDILEDSENPVDQQFREDWARANEVGQAMYQNDIEAVKGYMENDPEVFGGKANYEDLMRKLMQKYPHIYGRGRYEDTLRNAGKPLFKPKPLDSQSSMSSRIESKINSSYDQNGQ